MTVGIVGLGLIGGSLARAYHDAGHRVLGFDRDASTVQFALLAGAVDEPLTEKTSGSVHCCSRQSIRRLRRTI